MLVYVKTSKVLGPTLGKNPSVLGDIYLSFMSRRHAQASPLTSLEIIALGDPVFLASFACTRTERSSMETREVGYFFDSLKTFDIMSFWSKYNLFFFCIFLYISINSVLYFFPGMRFSLNDSSSLIINSGNTHPTPRFISFANNIRKEVSFLLPFPLPKR